MQSTSRKTQLDDSNGFTFVWRRRRNGDDKMIGRYKHQRCSDCVDSGGRRVFSPNRFYTCAQVAEQGFCSYLSDGLFQCDVPLSRTDYKLCAAHYRECNKQPRSPSPSSLPQTPPSLPQTPPTPLSDQTKIPYYLREKMSNEQRQRQQEQLFSSSLSSISPPQTPASPPPLPPIAFAETATCSASTLKLKTIFDDLLTIDLTIERDINSAVMALIGETTPFDAVPRL